MKNNYDPCIWPTSNPLYISPEKLRNASLLEQIEYRRMIAIEYKNTLELKEKKQRTLFLVIAPLITVIGALFIRHYEMQYISQDNSIPIYNENQKVVLETFNTMSNQINNIYAILNSRNIHNNENRNKYDEISKIIGYSKDGKFQKNESEKEKEQIILSYE